MEKSRVTLYDWCRIVATLLVVIGHCFGDSGDTHIPIVEGNACSVYFRIKDLIAIPGAWVYTFHMAFFFAISGAVYAISERKYSDIGFLAKSKLHRLIVPYFIVGIFWMFPIEFFSGYYSGKKEFAKGFINFISFGSDWGHLWFLPCLFLIFISFYVINTACCLVTNVRKKENRELNNIVIGGGYVCRFVFPRCLYFCF